VKQGLRQMRRRNSAPMVQYRVEDTLVVSKQIQVWTHGPDSVTPSDEAVQCLARRMAWGASYLGRGEVSHPSVSVCARGTDQCK